MPQETAELFYVMYPEPEPASGDLRRLHAHCSSRYRTWRPESDTVMVLTEEGITDVRVGSESHPILWRVTDGIQRIDHQAGWITAEPSEISGLYRRLEGAVPVRESAVGGESFQRLQETFQERFRAHAAKGHDGVTLISGERRLLLSHSEGNRYVLIQPNRKPKRGLLPTDVFLLGKDSVTYKDRPLSESLVEKLTEIVASAAPKPPRLTVDPDEVLAAHKRFGF